MGKKDSIKSGHVFAVTAVILSVIVVLGGATGVSVALGKIPLTLKLLSPKPMVPAVRFSITPCDSCTNVQLDSPVSVHVYNGRLLQVHIKNNTDPNNIVPGMFFSNDAWETTQNLQPNSTYTLTAVAQNKLGHNVTKTISFSTIHKIPLDLGLTVAPENGAQVGMGAIIMVTFDQPIASQYQQDVESAFKFTMSSPMPIKGHWFTPTVLHFRPETFWPLYEKVTIHVDLNGLIMGPYVVTTPDFSQSFEVITQHISYVNAQTDTMKVYNDGKLVRVEPVSLGRPGFWTISGTLIVLYKEPVQLMDSATIGIPVHSPLGYYLNVYYDVAISSDGYYIHDAPWDVADHGHYNVSFGCIEENPSDAVWFYNFSVPGDVVVVTGTPLKASFADGEADWNIPWSQY